MLLLPLCLLFSGCFGDPGLASRSDPQLCNLGATPVRFRFCSWEMNHPRSPATKGLSRVAVFSSKYEKVLENQRDIGHPSSHAELEDPPLWLLPLQHPPTLPSCRALPWFLGPGFQGCSWRSTALQLLCHVRGSGAGASDLDGNRGKWEIALEGCLSFDSIPTSACFCLLFSDFGQFFFWYSV